VRPSLRSRRICRLTRHSSAPAAAASSAYTAANETSYANHAVALAPSPGYGNWGGACVPIRHAPSRQVTRGALVLVPTAAATSIVDHGRDGRRCHGCARACRTRALTAHPWAARQVQAIADFTGRGAEQFVVSYYKLFDTQRQVARAPRAHAPPGCLG
jgi:hypothetical protein